MDFALRKQLYTLCKSFLIYTPSLCALQIGESLKSNNIYCYQWEAWSKVDKETLCKRLNYIKYCTFIKHIKIRFQFHPHAQDGTSIPIASYTKGYMILEHTRSIKALTIFGEYSHPDIALGYMEKNKAASLEYLSIDYALLKSSDSLIRLIKKFPSINLRLTQVNLAQAYIDASCLCKNLCVDAGGMSFKSLHKSFSTNASNIEKLNIIGGNFATFNVWSQFPNILKLHPGIKKLSIYDNKNDVQTFSCIYKGIMLTDAIECLSLEIELSANKIKYIADILANITSIRKLKVYATENGIQPLINSLTNTQISDLTLLGYNNYILSPPMISTLASLPLCRLTIYFPIKFGNLLLLLNALQQVSTLRYISLNVKDCKVCINGIAQTFKLNELEELHIHNSHDRLMVTHSKNVIMAGLESEIMEMNINFIIQKSYRLRKLDLYNVIISSECVNSISKIIELSPLKSIKLNSTSLDRIASSIVAHMNNINTIRTVYLIGLIEDKYFISLISKLAKEDRVKSFLIGSCKISNENHGLLIRYLRYSVSLRKFGVIHCNIKSNVFKYMNALSKNILIEHISLFDETNLSFNVTLKDIKEATKNLFNLKKIYLSCDIEYTESKWTDLISYYSYWGKKIPIFKEFHL